MPYAHHEKQQGCTKQNRGQVEPGWLRRSGIFDGPGALQDGLNDTILAALIARAKVAPPGNGGDTFQGILFQPCFQVGAVLIPVIVLYGSPQGVPDGDHDPLPHAGADRVNGNSPGGGTLGSLIGIVCLGAMFGRLTSTGRVMGVVGIWCVETLVR
ncbi:MAG: hypothetical protein HGA82_02575 [Anaerolineales bacterium]|nr:hypothetical protein [Anaerolineales bacterium]